MIKLKVKSSPRNMRAVDIENAIKALSRKKLLIGVTAKDRKESGLNNAQLAWIFEKGAPEVKIPARPFLAPILRMNAQNIINGFIHAMLFAMRGDEAGVDRTLSSLGMHLVTAMRNYIRSSIPPPLSPNPVRKWVSLKLGKRGRPLSTSKRRSDYGTTPLIITGEFLRSLGFVIENK